MNSALVMSTSSAALNSMNSLADGAVARRRRERADARRAAALGRLEYVAAQREQHRAAPGEIDLDVELLSVAAARRDQFAVDALEP
jgi:hypothetical protein